MRELDISETEYIGLKAITFFNPSMSTANITQYKQAFYSAVPQLEAHGEIVQTRQNLLEEFTRVIAKERGLSEAMMRLANLLLILPPLQVIVLKAVSKTHHTLNRQSARAWLKTCRRRLLSA